MRMKSTLFLVALLHSATAASAAGTWRFAVSGDSRNCGDIVMPAVAKGAWKDGAQFYWHLGDLRAIYDFDQDLAAARGGKMNIISYEKEAWNDFIASQVAPFGKMPFFIGIGNHETVPPKSRAEFTLQFADWLDAPVLRDQRLADDPKDRILKTYYHWKKGGIDFVNLDNASAEEFDGDQVKWFEAVLDRDAADASVKGLVVGMHESLPNSWSCGHSMNDSAVGVDSGRRVYRDMLGWRAKTGKPLQVLASHSHFVMRDIFSTPYWKNAGKPDRGVLPGWIVGTGGAIRYALPDGLPPGMFAKTHVYGYLLAEVKADGSVNFSFRQIDRADVPADVEAKYGKSVVDECFAGNADEGFKKPTAASCFEE
jgi:hypothetical protein